MGRNGSLQLEQQRRKLNGVESYKGSHDDRLQLDAEGKEGWGQEFQSPGGDPGNQEQCSTGDMGTPEPKQLRRGEEE